MPTIVDTIYGTSTPIPYTNEEVQELQFTQLGDILFLVHPNHRPATLSRYGPGDWRYEIPVFDFGPYLEQADGDEEVSLSVQNVLDRITLTSTSLTAFNGVVPGALVEYPIGNQKALGVVVSGGGASCVIEPLEDRSLVLSREVYSSGLYSGWDTTNNVPTYANPITGTGVQVAFSNTQVVTRSSIGNYLRFADKDGNYRWMLVTGVGDILEQGAYGILARGNILSVLVPSGIVTKSSRTIYADLVASVADFFSAAVDVGRLYRLNFNDTVLHARVSGITNSSTAQVRLSASVPLIDEGNTKVLNSTTNDWRRGAWYPGNYPGAVTFAEQRLTFGGYRDIPQSLHMSRPGRFYDFATTDEDSSVQSDSAIDLTIASETVNQIQWMTHDTLLLMGTVGAEWSVGSGSDRAAITPTNVRAERQSAFGSAFSQALSIGRSTFYVQAGGHKLREITYDYSIDRHSSMDVTIFAEHILRAHGGAVALAFGLLPESVIYVLCADGQVCALTYEPDQKVYSWSRVILGGPGATVKSIETKTEDNVDVLYMVVERTVNGAVRRTLEKIVPTYEPDSPTDFSEMVFLDGWVAVDPAFLSGGTIVSGLDRFANQTVSALIDNTVHENLSVDSLGVLTLPQTPTERCIIGYPYTSLFESFPLEQEGRRGTTQGKIKAIDHFVLRCKDTIGFEHGLTDDALTREPLPTPFQHISDDVRVPLPNRYDTRATYIVAQSRAYPLTVLALFPESALHQ